MYTSDLEATHSFNVEMKTHAATARRATTARFSRSGDALVEEFTLRPPSTELAVERIPALVREVDALVQTLAATPMNTILSEGVNASEDVAQRAEEVDAFCRSLRPGPLQEIVGKQVTRLREAAQHLRSPSSRLTAELVSIGVEKPRTRPVPIRVTPFMGSALARAAAKVGVNARKHQGANSIRKTAAKPLYKWEKRRFLRGSTVAQPHIAASKADAGRKPKLAEEYLDEVDEAGMELHPCSEPGHYSRSSYSKPSAATSTASSFEFQIILTEEEVKALKYQRRRLEAEQRHLSRRTKPQLMSSAPPPAPTAPGFEHKKIPPPKDR
ncbi:hypothetical protein PF005_g17650 [Phytophthora fragariae]|uniref:Uncharacterized protein n=2 Tax=Phytophthora fragariae TaxID=53985 RepID=A0A6A4D1N8_9STRA|nr:hypothetical protein PF005_g17650 [Phytophthora fragariae]KAE9295349.1 hypothetical protein PF001_g17367 [Phytophthora fragariae]